MGLTKRVAEIVANTTLKGAGKQFSDDDDFDMTTEELNPEIFGSAGPKRWERLYRTDGSIKAAYTAVTLPMRSAKWSVKPYDDSEKAAEQAEIVRRAYWEELELSSGKRQARGHFADLMRHICLNLLLGTSPFEKVWKLVDGTYFWKRWVFIHPQSISSWETEENGEKEFALVTASNVVIPGWKVVTFVNDMVGSNYYGVSIIRAANKHFNAKDKMEKIDLMAKERFAMGIPVGRAPTGAHIEDKKKFKAMLKNVRANIKAYMYLPGEGYEFHIESGGQDAAGGRILETIDHHKAEILLSVHASFLNSGSAKFGSRADSEVKVDFLNFSVEAHLTDIKAVLDTEARELIDLNEENPEGYATMEYEMVRKYDFSDIASAYVTLINGGVITMDDGIEMTLRERFELPPIDKDAPSREERKDDEKPEVKEEEKKEPKVETKKVMAQKKNLIEREASFIRNITEVENYLGKLFVADERKLSGIENTMRKQIKNEYERAKTINVDGMVQLSSTGNASHRKFIFSVIDRYRDMLKAYHSSLFEKAALRLVKMADTTYRQSTSIDLRKINAALAVDFNRERLGMITEEYKSNVEAFIDTAMRQLEEDTLSNFSGSASLEETLNQTENLSFNRNIYRLATVTHGRTFYKNMIYNSGVKDSIIHYKMLLPKTMSLANLNPAGITAANLFLIHTVAEWNKRSPDGNTNVVSGKGMHHNSQEYWYTIYSEDIEEERERAAEQRKKLKIKLDKARS